MALGEILICNRCRGIVGAGTTGPAISSCVCPPEHTKMGRSVEVNLEPNQAVEEFKARLLSDEAKKAAIKGLSFRLGHTLNEAAVAAVLEEAIAAAESGGER